jgi:hypothetical protein
MEVYYPEHGILEVLECGLTIQSGTQKQTHFQQKHGDYGDQH